MIAKTAENIIGGKSCGLTNASKMPSKSFSLPARLTCPIGDKLADCAGTVCHGCYARKGRYAMENVINAQARRLAILERALVSADHRADWISAMIFLIKRQGRYFRWHDSGDIFSQQYLDLILDVVTLTPKVRHWIPTKEIGLISKNRERIESLPNLIVRVSDFLVGTSGKKCRSFHGSSVNADAGVKCRASEREGNCGGCRKCWNREIQNIDYKKH
mgnify:CR=1 FL=1